MLDKKWVWAKMTRSGYKKKKRKKYRRCRGSNPGHPRDRREYLPLYYNDLFVALELSNIISSFLSLGTSKDIAVIKNQETQL